LNMRVYNTVLSVEEAIQITTSLLEQGAELNLVRAVLINDGFTSQKADVILRWAQRNCK
jgi:hypothetical protein